MQPQVLIRFTTFNVNGHLITSIIYIELCRFIDLQYRVINKIWQNFDLQKCFPKHELTMPSTTGLPVFLAEVEQCRVAEGLTLPCGDGGIRHR